MNFVFPNVPLPVWWIFSYAIFVEINIWGIELTLKVSLVLACIASIIGGAIYSGSWSFERLFNIEPTTGNSVNLPFGWEGIFAAIPFAIWFYLAIEELPLAAKETENIAKDMQKAMFVWHIYSVDPLRTYINHQRRSG